MNREKEYMQEAEANNTINPKQLVFMINQKESKFQSEKSKKCINNIKKTTKINKASARESKAFNTGSWSQEEESIFLKAAIRYGHICVQMQEQIKSRSLIQIRSHAQKIYQKALRKEQQRYKQFWGVGSKIFFIVRDYSGVHRDKLKNAHELLLMPLFQEAGN